MFARTLLAEISQLMDAASSKIVQLSPDSTRYGNQSWDEVDSLVKYYGDTLNPDGPERYVDAWNHIHDISDKIGAHNVVWVWSPGVGAAPDVPWNSVGN